MSAKLAAMLAVVALAVSAFGTVEPASATSFKCAQYGHGIRYGLQNGLFCDQVNGTGTNIDTITGSFGQKIFGLDTVCNPSMKMDVYDRYGRWITWRQGPQRGGCFPWSSDWVPSIGVWRGFPQAAGGSVRVTLQSYGQPVAANWHGIY
jgi:hypothetical protein